jgi:putative hydrolase of the HAD superfamily
MSRGLLFDLFNTLVPSGDRGRVQVTRDMGAVLGVDADRFAWAFVQSWPERMTGGLGDLAAQCRTLAGRLGAAPSDTQVDAAVQMRLAFNRATVVVDDTTLAAIDAVRAAGWPVAVVSNCTIDSATFIRDTVLAPRVDAMILSCEVGIAKPDPEIYRRAAVALGAVPEKCVFVGDGADRELSGAAALGMRVIQTRQYAHTDPDWAGERVDNLAELPALLLSDRPG